MTCAATRPAATSAAPPLVPAPSPAPWRAELDEVAAVLAETRAARDATPRVRAAVAAAIAQETGGSLDPAAVERLAARVARLVA